MLTLLQSQVIEVAGSAESAYNDTVVLDVFLGGVKELDLGRAAVDDQAVLKDHGVHGVNPSLPVVDPQRAGLGVAVGHVRVEVVFDIQVSRARKYMDGL